MRLAETALEQNTISNTIKVLKHTSNILLKAKRLSDIDLEVLVSQTITKYQSEPIVLDGFFQWASNPSSKSARCGDRIKQNISYIKENLVLRYGTHSNSVEKSLEIVLLETEKLVAKARGVSKTNEDARQLTMNLIKGNLSNSDILEKNFLKMAQALPEKERNLLGFAACLDLDNNFVTSTDSPLTYHGRQLIASLIASGSNVDPEQIENILIKAGFVNKLLWISSGKTGSRENKLIAPYYAKRSKDILRLSFLPSLINKSGYFLEELKLKKKYSEIALLDEIAESTQGTESIENRSDLVNLPLWEGVVGKYKESYAISPLVIEDLRRGLLKLKKELSHNLEQKIDNIMNLRKMIHGSRAEFIRRNNGFAHWQISIDASKPPVDVIVVPWLSYNLLKNTKTLKEELVVFLSHQPLVTAEKVLREYGEINQVYLITEEGAEKKLGTEFNPIVEELLASFQQLTSGSSKAQIEIILDASNIAKEDHPHGRLRFQNLVLAENYFRDKRFLVIADESLLNDFKKKGNKADADAYRKHLNLPVVSVAPSRIQADILIFKVALQNPGSKIVTKDEFKDFRENPPKSVLKR